MSRLGTHGKKGAFLFCRGTQEIISLGTELDSLMKTYLNPSNSNPQQSPSWRPHYKHWQVTEGHCTSKPLYVRNARHYRNLKIHLRHSDRRVRAGSMLVSICTFLWPMIHIARRSGPKSSFESELEFYLPGGGPSVTTPRFIHGAATPSDPCGLRARRVKSPRAQSRISLQR